MKFGVFLCFVVLYSVFAFVVLASSKTNASIDEDYSSRLVKELMIDEVPVSREKARFIFSKYI